MEKSNSSKKMKTRFKVGDRVRIKKTLSIGECYPMKHNSSIDDMFVAGMDKYKGKEATVMEVFLNKYILDIDDGYLFTDGMLNGIADVKAREEYSSNREVEELINHVSSWTPVIRHKLAVNQKNEEINKALDSGDKELFMKLTEELKFLQSDEHI